MSNQKLQHLGQQLPSRMGTSQDLARAQLRDHRNSRLALHPIEVKQDCWHSIDLVILQELHEKVQEGGQQ